MVYFNIAMRSLFAFMYIVQVNSFGVDNNSVLFVIKKTPNNDEITMTRMSEIVFTELN
jgi:hypothetical protein